VIVWGKKRPQVDDVCGTPGGKFRFLGLHGRWGKRGGPTVPGRRKKTGGDSTSSIGLSGWLKGSNKKRNSSGPEAKEEGAALRLWSTKPRENSKRR